MENFFARYKNPLVLMAVLFIQVVMLATQVKRPEGGRAAGGGGTRLIRVWTVTAFTPIQKLFISTGHFFRNSWHNYADLRSVRKQNKDLQNEIDRLQMEQVRLRQDADQARRLQALLEFREKTVAKTVAAQVIGTSGTEQSRVIIIDKGSRDGIKPDMAVITPDGIVGKVKDVFPLSSQVLLINDHDSGAGVILESSRLQGVLKGLGQGELQITDIMSDEKVEAGEHVITSGGDRIFPKGLSVGTVISATPDRDNDPFLSIKVKPSSDLRRLEEVLVITRTTEETPVASGSTPMRAADILSQRLPSIPKQDPNAPKSTPPGSASPTPRPAPANAAQKKESAAATGGVKPPTPGSTGVAPSTSKPAGGGATTGQASAPKTGTDTKKPVGVTGQSSTTGAAATDGSATPTPTPKPKATPAKNIKSSVPADGTQEKTPKQAGTGPAAMPTATPATTQEKPPR
jgi:rod shape-determining protein MreC